MNQAASQDSRKPNLGNTGQYTISVSKPGVGEGPQPQPLEVYLKVAFHTKADPGTIRPIACQVVVWDNKNNCRSDEKFDFIDGTLALVIIKLGTSWQQDRWWADLYLDYGPAYEPEYAVSVHLSTVISNNMTVSCSYRSDFGSDGRDG